MDSLDIDALDDLHAHEGYALVCDRVMEEINRNRDALETVPTNLRGCGSVEFLQGFLAACRMFLVLPEQLQTEIQSEVKKEA